MNNVSNNIVFVWELGNHNGHLVKDIALAISLRNEGHNVTFIVDHKKLDIAAKLLTPNKFEFILGPTEPLPIVYLNRQLNYSCILLSLGWGNNLELLKYTNRWCNVIESLKPDIIIADHSPIAILVSFITRIKIVLFGTGFEIPPLVYPMPSIRHDLDIDIKQLEYCDNALIKSINYVLTSRHAREISNIFNLFNRNSLLTTIKELDHYSVRTNGEYIGSINAVLPINNTNINFSNNGKQKILVYIQKEYFNIVLKVALEEYDAICVIPNIDSDIICTYSTDSFKISDKLINIDNLKDEDYILISHCSHGTVEKTLLQGKVQITIPTHPEQRMLSNIIESSKFGICIKNRSSVDVIKEAINNLINDPVYKLNVTELASKYKDINPVKSATTYVLKQLK